MTDPALLVHHHRLGTLPSRDLKGYLQVPLPLHLFEQHSLFCEQAAPGPPHAQSGSLPELHTPGSQQPSANPHAGQTLSQPVPGSQLSVVHGSPSSQLMGSFTHPVAGTQLSVVQASLSSQLSGVPA